VLSDKVVNKDMPTLLASIPDESPATEVTLPTINDLVGDMPFAAIRTIIHTSSNMEEVERAVARYRQDPQKFEAEMDRL
jgi:hypothetical protein